MMNWLKEIILDWLGIDVGAISRITSDVNIVRNLVISSFKRLNRVEKLTHDLVSIGVDVHVKQQTVVLIYSKLNGGQLIDIAVDFKDIDELRQFVDVLRTKYSTDNVVWDIPRNIKEFLQ